MTRVYSGLCLVTFVLCGCGGSDLSDYRPISAVPVHKTVQTQKDDPTASLQVPQTDSAIAAVEEELPVSALVPVNVIDGSSVSNLLKGSAPAPGTVPPIQPVSATAVEKPRTVEVLIPDKSFQRDNATKGLRVSYDDLDLLKVLNLEPVTSNAVELMPSWLKELNGQRIRIRGFMYPTFEPDGIERFVLARDNQICCFGRDPKVYDLIQVDLQAGKTTRYIPPTRAFDVIGTFKIELELVDDKPFGLYYISDAQIIEK